MRLYDRFVLAFRHLHGGWAILPVLGFAIGVFCLAYAGTTAAAVEREKSMPCELTITAPDTEGISDEDAAGIAALPGVLQASPVLAVPVTVTAGNTSFLLTLTGIRADFINGNLSQGTLFPEDGVMPCLILDENALALFSAKGTGTATPQPSSPAVYWLNTGITLRMSADSRPIAAKVCGLLADSGDDEPGAYISLSTAKQLLRQAGLSTQCMTARVQIDGRGQAEQVTQAISLLGFDVAATEDTLQSSWDTRMQEVTCLALLGAGSLLYSAMLLLARERIIRLKYAQVLNMLPWMGLTRRQAGLLPALQAPAIAAAGGVLGLAAAWVLPVMLPQALQDTSVFALPIPPRVAGAVAAIALAVGAWPLIGTLLWRPGR